MTTTMTTLQVPLQDKREYRALTLGNGLRCLFIHEKDSDDTGAGTDDDDTNIDNNKDDNDDDDNGKDTTTTTTTSTTTTTTAKAALSTAVHVGQFHDGASTPGLAHLTEHAVFLGSHAFPDTSGLDAYLAQRGGSSNAYTDCQMTVYYMDFAPQALHDVAERWAACLAQPLLDTNVLGKEINAVDSEHAKNQQQDVWRFNHLSRTLLGSHGNSETPVHPYATFGSGNKASLLLQQQQQQQQERDGDGDGADEKDIAVDETARIQVLRDSVAEFCQKYYRAPFMTLCILSHHSLDEMQAVAEQYFTQIPTRHDDDDDDPNMSLPPLDTSHALPAVVHVVPIRESHTLVLQWPMRETASLYRHKPARVLSHLLGHEGPGSLTAILRQDAHWLQDLYADDGSTSTTIFTIFSLHLELTAAGWENVHHVVRLIYAYITQCLADIPAWVHKELQTTADMSFRFLSQYDAMSTVSAITPDMLKYPEEHYLSGMYRVFEDFDAALVQECWQALNVDNMLMMVAAKEYESLANLETEKWYGTQYCKANVDSDVWEMWKNPMAERHFDNADQQAQEALHQSFLQKLRLPDPNDMVATNFDLIPPQPQFFPETNSPPRCLMEADVCQLWYKPDTAFGMPKVNVIFCLETTAIHTESPYASVLSNIWVDAVTELCLEFSYAASMAGLHGQFGSSRQGLTLDVSGYNHKVPVLLRRLIATAKETATRLTPELFERLRETREKRFLEFLVSQPYRHAVNALDLCLDRPKWDIMKRLECVKEVTLADLQMFAKRLLTRFRLKGLVHGNVSAQEAKSLAEIVLDGFQPKPPLVLPELRVSRLSPGDSVYRMAGYNKEEAVSCAVSLYQFGTMDAKVDAALSVLNHLVSEPAYSILRTEEQLGYVVFSQIKTSGINVKQLLLLVQGDAYDPIHMSARMEAFVQNFRQSLVSMSTDEFATNLAAVVQILTEKKKNLPEEAYAHWQFISNETYHFDRLNDIAEIVKTLSKEDILRFFDRFLLAGSPERRKLTVQVFGNEHLECMSEPVADGIHVLDSVDDFIRHVPLYPLPERVPITDDRRIQSA